MVGNWERAIIFHREAAHCIELHVLRYSTVNFLLLLFLNSGSCEKDSLPQLSWANAGLHPGQDGSLLKGLPLFCLKATRGVLWDVGWSTRLPAKNVNHELRSGKTEGSPLSSMWMIEGELLVNHLICLWGSSQRHKPPSTLTLAPAGNLDACLRTVGVSWGKSKPATFLLYQPPRCLLSHVPTH